MRAEAAGQEQAHLVKRGIVIPSEAGRRRSSLILLGPQVGRHRHRREWNGPFVGAVRIPPQLELAAKGRELRAESADVAGLAGSAGLGGKGRHGPRRGRTKGQDRQDQERSHSQPRQCSTHSAEPHAHLAGQKRRTSSRLTY